MDNNEQLSILRHSASHLLAQAVKRLRPCVKLAIGPAIDSGFYYDFDSEEPFNPEFLEELEGEMKKISKENLKIERFALPREEALELMKDEPYKTELINDLPEGEEISFYKQGEFTDLCAGPHVNYTSKVKAFKLLSCTGAYWRGSEKNKMLTRVYGTAFPSKAELDEYLNQLEEAKKRDHRKLGRDLDLYMIVEEGPGFPFFLPNGMIVRNELLNFWRKLHEVSGYQEINTPIILNEDLWHRSGHWDHYKENMYFTKIDEGDYAVKPMNCPGGMLAYKRHMYSYRDLPLRMCELGLVHRHELSGALHGLMRVRCFTQDDAHIFMTRDHMLSELLGVMNLVDTVYSVFGFDYHVELSTRPEDFMGEKETWDFAEDTLKKALEESGVRYVVNEGDGAFYGPKIDYKVRDSIGRIWQCGTIQLDFQMPERFELEYIAQDGSRQRPVMIHRAIFGSIERFIAILTEHYAGAFPLWLAPLQVKVLPITSRSQEAAEKVIAELKAAGVRVEGDFDNEKIGYKIRQAQLMKIPYMLVIGDKEVESGLVSVRNRTEGDIGTMTVSEFAEKVTKEISDKV